MNRNASFIRKIVYISLMALLLIPLSFLSQPSGLDVEKHPGGKLDRERRANDLSQSSLGEVDPTSETMKLASLGMRGVATTILWQQANEHKKKENWDAFAAVLRQISKLQPHFIQVWIFQSWNQSYNVSVEFDNYEFRYLWVKKGIDYLIEGTRYNQRDVKLQWHLGWVFGHKIGRSDERRQFRRLFKVDDDFHAGLPIDYNDPKVTVRDYQGKIDNWLVGREFFLRAIRIAESPSGSKEWGQSPVLFFSEPPMQRMNYAETIIEEGEFGRQAREAWRISGEEWKAYGERHISTSISGVRIQLNALEKTEERIEALSQELETLSRKLEGDVRDELRQEKLDALNDEERQAFELPEDQRSDEQRGIAALVERKLEVTFGEIFNRAPEDVKQGARRLILQRDDLLTRARFMRSYRNIVNFDYWGTRCAAEQTETMINARRDVHDAAILYERGILTRYTDPITGEEKLGAKEVYERAWQGWAEIFAQYPVMLDNPETEDLLEHVQDYRELLGQLEQDLPDDFDLQIVVDIFDSLGHRRPNSEELAMLWALQRTDPRYALPKPPTVPEQAIDGDDPRNAPPRPPSP